MKVLKKIYLLGLRKSGKEPLYPELLRGERTEDKAQGTDNHRIRQVTPLLRHDEDGEKEHDDEDTHAKLLDGIHEGSRRTDRRQGPPLQPVLGQRPAHTQTAQSQTDHGLKPELGTMISDDDGEGGENDEILDPATMLLALKFFSYT